MANIFNTLLDSIKYWYMPMILGIIFIVCGVYTLTVPLEAYVTLSVIFSISFLVSGLAETFFALQNTKSLHGWGWYLVDGLLSLVIGIYLLVNPGVSIAVLPFVVGFTLMFRSFQLLGFALDLRDHKVLSWGDLALASVLGIILSFLLLSSPLFTGISLVALTSSSMIFIGVASIVLSLKLKKLKDAPEKIDADLRKRMLDVQNEIDRSLSK